MTLRWIAGALACGLSSAVMGMTKTTHPPAGATALLAAVDPQVVALGWYLLPLVLLSSVLMLLCALLVNNIQRQFPTYWWTPADLHREREGRDREGGDIEKRPESMGSSDVTSGGSQTSGQTHSERDIPQGPQISVSGAHIFVPDWIYLADEERYVLEVLKDRLMEGRPSNNPPESQHPASRPSNPPGTSAS